MFDGKIALKVYQVCVTNQLATISKSNKLFGRRMTHLTNIYQWPKSGCQYLEGLSIFSKVASTL
jgi:hypothetical protein